MSDDATAGQRRQILLGLLCAVLATLFWSGNFIVARGLSEHITPATLAFMRWSTACLLVLPLGLPALRRDWSIIKSDLPLLVLTAFLGVTCFNTLLYQGARSTSAMNLALISTTFPVFIIILSRIFLGEPVTLRRILGVAMAVLGVTALVTQGEFQRLLELRFKEGDLWMLLAAFDFALYSMMVRRRPKGLGQVSFVAFTFGAGLLMLTPLMLWEQTHHPWPAMDWDLAGAVLYIGLMASVASYFLWNRAVLTAGPARAGIVYYAIPVFSGVEAWAILGEPLTLLHGVAGGGIIAGIFIATAQPLRRGIVARSHKGSNKAE